MKGVLLFLLLFGLGWNLVRPLQEYDIWLHLGAGERIVSTGHIPRTDIYSFSAFGAPWVYHEWLFAVLVYCLYAVFGLSVLNLLQALLMTGMATLLLALLLHLVPPSPLRLPGIMAWLIAGNFALETRFHLRPHQVSLFLLALLLFILYRGGAWRWLLPVIFPVWANIHGDVLQGVALLGLWGWCAAFTDRRLGGRWLLAATGAALLTMLNPYGWRLWAMAWEIAGFGVYHENITEWMPFPPEVVPEVLGGLFALTLVSALACRDRACRFELVLAALGVLGALKASRYAAPALILCTPLYGAALARLVRRLPPRTWWKPLGLLGAGALMFLFLTNLDPRVGLGYRVNFYPFPAFAFMREHKLHGRTFANYEYATALTTCGYPANPHYIDGRWDVFGEEIFRRYLLAMNGADGRELLDGERVDVVLLRTQPFDYLSGPQPALAGVLAGDPAWGLAFWDDVSLLFVRRAAFPDFAGGYAAAWPLLEPDAATADSMPAVRAMVARMTAESSAHIWAYLVGARMAAEAGDTDQARDWYQSGLGRQPGNAVLLTDYAGFMLAQGDSEAGMLALQAAMRMAPDYYLPYRLYGEQKKSAFHLHRALALRPDLMPLRIGLARLYVEQGFPDRAAVLLAAAPPNDDLIGLLLLAGFWQEQGDFASAIPPLQRYLARQPQANKVWLSLATCHIRLRQFEPAQEIFARLEAAGETDPVLYADYGALLMARGDWAGAARRLNRALAVEPGLAAARRNLAMLRLHHGDVVPAPDRGDTALIMLY